MAETSFTTGDLTESDLDAALDIQTLSFGQMPADYEPTWRQHRIATIQARRLVGVRDGDRLVGHAMVRPFRQYWGGRDLPMAGIGAVAVAPEYRGRGTGSLLMRAVLERAVELGDAVSALYPATIPLYRRLGWELAGGQYRISVDAAALRRLGPAEVPVHRAGESDLDAVLEHVCRHWASLAASGPKELEAATTRRDLTDPNTFCYRADDGLLIYAWDDGDVTVRHLTAGSEPTARALWSLVGSGSSIVKTVHAHVGPHDPVHLMLSDVVSSAVRQERWMLRLLDAPAAIQGRGYPVGVDLDVPIAIADPLAPGCDGAWRLRIGAGAGSLEPSAPATDGLRLGPNGLAAMYAGTPLSTLRMVGLASGGRPDDDALLDAAFTATPYMLEYF
jgi:predicted acetyltransferase